MAQQQRRGSSAIMIGGSLAGPLAARVLAEHFARVTIVERDALTTAAQPRKGIPQARHAHALLGGGREVLEMLFCGITAALVERGALRDAERSLRPITMLLHPSPGGAAR